MEIEDKFRKYADAVEKFKSEATVKVEATNKMAEELKRLK